MHYLALFIAACRCFVSHNSRFSHWMRQTVCSCVPRGNMQWFSLFSLVFNSHFYFHLLGGANGASRISTMYWSIYENWIEYKKIVFKFQMAIKFSLAINGNRPFYPLHNSGNFQSILAWRQVYYTSNGCLWLQLHGWHNKNHINCFAFTLNQSQLCCFPI